MKKNKSQNKIHKKVSFNLSPQEKHPHHSIDTNYHQDVMTNSHQEVTKAKDSNIIVSVRVRPLNSKELDVTNIEILKINNNQLLVSDPIEYNGPEEIFKNRSREQIFTFDYAFSKESTQEEIYNKTTMPFVSGVIEGYNLTVFAYGISGAGKTFTMLGTGEQPGIIPRSLADLFKLISSSNDKEYKVKMTYIEIYKENLRDLLSNNEEPLEIREDPVAGVKITGAKEIDVISTREIFQSIIKGNKRRTIDFTNHNDESSRSHGVLQITVEIKVPQSGDGNYNIGKFILVDLAGSERSINNIKSSQKTKIEGGNINTSLLSLGRCIKALANIEKGAKTFVSWRDSKLTRVLKDSLSGNSRIVMIVNVSPSILSFEDTINTLNYASKAKNIKTAVKKNVYEHSPTKYDEVINAMKDEIDELKRQLETKTETDLTKKSNSGPNKKIESIQNAITKHFQEEIKIKKDIIEIENKVNHLKLEINKGGIDNSKKGNISKEKKKEEIQSLNNKLDEKYTVQYEAFKKRDELQKQINQLSKDQGSHNLLLQYQYYTVLLENMNLEHKKQSNSNELIIKEIQVEKLFDQIKLRDDFINKASNKLRKNKVELKLNSQIKSIDDLELEPISLVLPQIIINDDSKKSPSNGKPQSNVFKAEVKDNNNLALPNIGVNLQRQITPTRQYGYELSKSPFIKKPKPKYNEQVNLLKNELKQMNGVFHNEKKEQINNLDTEGYYNKSIISNSSDSNEVLNKFGHQMEMKTKTILRRNIFGRYKNSPYLRSSPYASH